MAGWRIVIPEAPPPRCVIIGVPHTSSWDLAMLLLVMFGGGFRMGWMAKASLFRWPLGPLLRALGGIPVERSSRGDFVAQMVAAFAPGQPMILGLSPEGTRDRAEHWKSGFYHIARGADVPIVLGYADYRRRVVGLGPTLRPSGDLAADMALIRDFYSGIEGHYPERQGPIALANEQ